MAYNFQHNKSPQPFGGRGKQGDAAASSRNIGVPAAPASPFRPASSSPLPMAPRMSAPMDTHAASPGPLVLRRQLLSPQCGSSASPQSSPCPSPVAGARLRPHSIALTSTEGGGGGSPQQQLQHFLGFGSGSQSAFQPVPAVVRRQAPSAVGNGRNGSVSPRPASWKYLPLCGMFSSTSLLMRLGVIHLRTDLDLCHPVPFFRPVRSSGATYPNPASHRQPT